MCKLHLTKHCPGGQATSKLRGTDRGSSGLKLAGTCTDLRAQPVMLRQCLSAHRHQYSVCFRYQPRGTNGRVPASGCKVGAVRNISFVLSLFSLLQLWYHSLHFTTIQLLATGQILSLSSILYSVLDHQFTPSLSSLARWSKNFPTPSRD
jgi:hypothetical protein